MTQSSESALPANAPRRRRFAELEVLRQRNFRLLFIGQSSSLLGDGMTSLALSFAVLDLTGSTTDLGLVLAARSLPLITLLLLGGALADRYSRRRVMLCADLTRLCSQALLAALLISRTAHIWELLILAAVPGAASAFFNPASTGLLASIVDAEHRQTANALRSIAIASTNIAGPLLAGLIVAATSPGWAIAADSLSFAISAIFLSRLHPPASAPLPGQALLGRLIDGFHAVRSRTWIGPVVLSLGLVNMFFGWFLVLGVVIARQSLGGPQAWSLILAGFAAGSIFGSVAALRHQPHHPLLTGLLWLSFAALPPAALALAAPLAINTIATFLAGSAIMMFNASWETCLQQHVPVEMLSRVSSYDWLGSAALNPLGYALAGPAAAALTTTSSLWIAATVIALASLAPLTSRAVRQLPPAPSPERGPSPS